ncbi:MAG: Ppx/GppA phosphatase family protein [Veillonellales bacterium]
MHTYSNGAYNLVYNQKETVRLSEGMSKDGLLQPTAMIRAIATLQVFAHMIRLFNVNKIMAIATAAVRNAKNGSEFIQTARQETGIPLRMISGEAEAKLGFLGVVNTLDVTDALLFDLGGGSTELTLIRSRNADKVISLPFGAVNLAEKFELQKKISDSRLNELCDFIFRQISRIKWLKSLSLPLIGVGGTARNIAKMDQRCKNYPFGKVHNYRLGALSFHELFKQLSSTTLSQRRKTPGLSSERADIILPGMSIVSCLFDYTQASQLIISGCGVREGMFLQYYRSCQGQNEVIADILDHSTRNMLSFYQVDASHATHVAILAASLLKGWQPLLNTDSREKTLLQVAALLHDCGIPINYYDHPRHSAYLIENARLFGLTHREQMLVAVIAGWHNGPSGKYIRNKLYSEFFDKPDWETARKLSLLLAMAESLDITQMQLVQAVTATLEEGQAVLRLTVSESAAIEEEAVMKHSKWFKKELGVPLCLQS